MFLIAASRCTCILLFQKLPSPAPTSALAPTLAPKFENAYVLHG